MIETTTDRFLGGRLSVQQPAHGFRAGLDAVVLAAAVPAGSDDHVLELGSGCGTSSLCLAARVAGCTVTGIETDSDLVCLSLANAASNTLEERVRFIEGDVFSPPRTVRKTFSHVFANPPFHHHSDPSSDNMLRRRAMRDALSPADWLKAGMKRVKPGGTMSMIVRTDRLSGLLSGAPDGGITILPLWSRAGQSAKRIIIQIQKGSRARLALLPGLVLHERDGKYTKEADSILRGDSALHLSANQSEE